VPWDKRTHLVEFAILKSIREWGWVSAAVVVVHAKVI